MKESKYEEKYKQPIFLASTINLHIKKYIKILMAEFCGIDLLLTLH